MNRLRSLLRSPAPPEAHDLKYMLLGFETHQTVMDRRSELVRILHGQGGACDDLARRLEQCRRRTPCCSGACPLCLRKYRRWLVDKGLPLSTAGRIPLEVGGIPKAVASSCIPIWLRSPPGRLLSVDLGLAGNRLRKAISRSPLNDYAVLGGWDISFNEDSRRHWAPHWQPHLYLVVLGLDAKATATESLRPSFPKGGRISKPVVSTDVTDPFRSLSYACKSAFFRRVSYLGRNGRQETWSGPMKPDQRRELALFLDQLGLSKRLFLHRLRQEGDQLVERTKRSPVSDIPTKGRAEPRSKGP
jgi:hypothetical protein